MISDTKKDIVEKITEIGRFEEYLFSYGCESIEEFIEKALEGEYCVSEGLNTEDMDKIIFYAQYRLEHTGLVQLMQLAEKYDYEVTIHPETDESGNADVLEIFLQKEK